MTTNIPFTWTDEAVETLKRLWKEGLSASVIAAEMGHGLTRNSIVGKVHRLGLPSRRTVVGHFAPNGIRDVEGKARAAKARKSAKPKPVPKVEAPVFEAAPLPEEELGNDVTNLLGLMDLTAYTCRYPHGDPLSQPFGFCGKHTQEGSPYCAEHHAKCHWVRP